VNKERVVFFLDFANIDRAARDRGARLDWGHLSAYLGEGRFLVESHAYFPVDPRAEHRLDLEIERLWEAGYIVHRKVGSATPDSYKCNFDVEIAMDVMETVHQVRPDIIVLGTGDGDFVPLILRVRSLGVRVEVASFLPTTAKTLRLMSSGFVNIEQYLVEMESRSARDPSMRNDEDDVEQGAHAAEGLEVDAPNEHPFASEVRTPSPPQIP
jgi:uncharacterized LabA/DUF88 family protein